jgi:hypothetical protein
MTFLELGTLLPPFYPVANEFRLITVIQSGHRPTAPTTLGKLPLQEFETLWSMMQRMWASEGHLIPGSATIYSSLLRLVTSLLLNELRKMMNSDGTWDLHLIERSLWCAVRRILA